MNGTSFALITLGANSFSLMIAASHPHEPSVQKAYKRKVRLLEHISADGQLHDASIQRAQECLSFFYDCLKQHQIDAQHVHIFATAPLREMSQPQYFHQMARDSIPYPIQVLSPEQECHFIYQGTRITTELQDPCLIIDIGGGSTEIILGQQQRILAQCSIPLGCLNVQSYFLKERLKEHDISRVQQEVNHHLALHLSALQQCIPHSTVGTSGIIQALTELPNRAHQEPVITRKWIKLLLEQNIGRTITAPNLVGLKESRKPTFIAGLLILNALFEALNLEHIRRAHGALREGLLHYAYTHTTPPV
tara:strand:+ start:11891 stop:12808 length:918 start_codon:yes stop_codon:yes gene_type:complete